MHTQCYSQEQLLEYSEDPSGSLAPAIANHLLDCSDCRKEIALFEQSWDLLGKWEAPEPSYTLKAQVWEKIRLAPTRNQPNWVQRALSVMSLMAAAAICMTFWSQSLSVASGNVAPVAVKVDGPAMAAQAPSTIDIPSDSVLVFDEDSEEFRLTAAVNLEGKDSLGEFSHDLLDAAENEMPQGGASEL
jgi:hypothetical protein